MISASIAQLEEHPPCKWDVVGSIPTGGLVSVSWPHRLLVRIAAFHFAKRGFDSPWGHFVVRSLWVRLKAGRRPLKP